MVQSFAFTPLALPEAGLTGHIPPELGQLHGLTLLDLSDNSLKGFVPRELGQLGNLRTLRLRGNEFLDAVPPSLYALPEHDLLDGRFCRRSSGLRAQLLDDCELLLAIREQLLGSAEINWRANVPIAAWEGVILGGMEGRVCWPLSCPRGGLTGRIPPEFGRLRGLRSIKLARNKLTGHIPPELGQLDGLRSLVLDFNALTGDVPAELGRLPKLESLWLGNNQLTGAVPPELFDLHSHDLGLLVFCLPSSGMASELFRDCTNLLSMLEVLDRDSVLNWHSTLPLGEWQGVTIGGDIPRVVGLELPRIGLRGHIPDSLGDLHDLRTLVLDGNVLTGSIPPRTRKTWRAGGFIPCGERLDRFRSDRGGETP